MWGNTQEVSAPPNAFTNPNANEQKITLCRVGYNRPDTWRFLLSAQLKSAPATAVGDQANVSVWFELYTGIGRSVMRLPFWVTLPGWNWNFGLAVPINVVDWTNQAQAGVATSFTDEVPAVTTTYPIFTDEIVGHDMTLIAHVNFVTDIPGVTQPAIVEVNAQFAPNTHVRPDWMQVDKPPAEQFAGGETRGH